MPPGQGTLCLSSRVLLCGPLVFGSFFRLALVVSACFRPTSDSIRPHPGQTKILPLLQDRVAAQPPLFQDGGDLGVVPRKPAPPKRGAQRYTRVELVSSSEIHLAISILAASGPRYGPRYAHPGCVPPDCSTCLSDPAWALVHSGSISRAPEAYHAAYPRCPSFSPGTSRPGPPA